MILLSLDSSLGQHCQLLTLGGRRRRKRGASPSIPNKDLTVCFPTSCKSKKTGSSRKPPAPRGCSLPPYISAEHLTLLSLKNS